MAKSKPAQADRNIETAAAVARALLNEAISSLAAAQQGTAGPIFFPKGIGKISVSVTIPSGIVFAVHVNGVGEAAGNVAEKDSPAPQSPP